MASNSSSPDLGESIKEIRAQIDALTKTLGDLAEDTADMRSELAQRVSRPRVTRGQLLSIRCG